MTRTFTVQAKAVEKIVQAVVTRGVDAERLYRSVSFDSALLADPDSRMPFAQLVALYESAAELTGDREFGLHMGESATVSNFDLLGYCARNSATVGGAFNRLARYNSIWTDGSVFNLESHGETSAIVYVYVDSLPGATRQDAEMTLSMIATQCRKFASPEFGLTAVEFQHAAPADVSEHGRVFDCAVTFGAPSNRLLFPSTHLALPIAKADASLGALLDRQAEELLVKFPPRESLLDRLRNAIADELPGGDPSLEVIAEQLSFTPRTLQRKLQELGTSYNDILDQMRRHLAIRYLREPQLAICEVAYLLGFSESSSFHRAFKRWTGVTPKEFRNA